MTKEQAIIDKIARLNSETWKDREDVRTEIGKLLSELEKALEKQPSEDCVSRAEMLKYQQYLRGKMPNEENHKLWEFIQSLPPVTPTRKVGKWIYHFERDDYNDYENEYYECPFCHDLGGDKDYHYCPVCGNKVKGVEDGSN